MSTAGDGEGDASGKRGVLVLAALGAAVVLGLVAMTSLRDAAAERQRAEELRRARERDAAMVRDVVERESRRPAPASGVRLLPRTLVRTGSERTVRVRGLGWSPGGERFAVVREDWLPFHGFRRDVVVESAEVYDLDGKFLREVPLPPVNRGVLANRDALFALTSAGTLIVEEGAARLRDLEGKETARIRDSDGGPIRGAAVLASGRILAWTEDRVLFRGADGADEGVLPVDFNRVRIWSVELSPDGRSLLVHGDAGGGWWNSNRFVLDAATGQEAALRGTPDRVAWIPGSDDLLAGYLRWEAKPRRFEVMASDGKVRATVPGVGDAQPLADGSGILGHCLDGALRLWDREGKERLCVPGVLDGKWSDWNWWRGMPMALAVPPKGEGFATLRNADGEYVRLWSAAGAPLARDPLPGKPGSARFSPDGTRILVTYASGIVAVLEIVREPAK